MAQVNAVGVYDWKPIYQELATKLLAFQHDRAPLLAFLRDKSVTMEGFRKFAEDEFSDGSVGFAQDMCPFTLFAFFNRSSRPEKRIGMIRELKALVNGVAPEHSHRASFRTTKPCERRSLRVALRLIVGPAKHLAV